MLIFKCQDLLDTIALQHKHRQGRVSRAYTKLTYNMCQKRRNTHFLKHAVVEVLPHSIGGIDPLFGNRKSCISKVGIC